MSAEIASSAPSLAHGVSLMPGMPAGLSLLVCLVAAAGVAWVWSRRFTGGWAWAGGARFASRLEPVALELFVADRGRCRALEGELRAALSRLQLVLGPALPARTSVDVQDTICQDGALAGCIHLGERAGGASYAIVHLALRVRERDLRPDEVLAVLVEQCLALAARRDAGTTIVLPVELPVPGASGEPGAGAIEPRSRAGDAVVAPPDPLAAPVPLAPLASYQGRDGLARTHRAG
jgi:hypothetical protein